MELYRFRFNLHQLLQFRFRCNFRNSRFRKRGCIPTYVVSNTARVGDVVQQLKNRHGLPCGERAELHDGRPYGRERLGNYSVRPPEAPSGFVPSCHHPECGQGFWKSPRPSVCPRFCQHPEERRYVGKYPIFLLGQFGLHCWLSSCLKTIKSRLG